MSKSSQMHGKSFENLIKGANNGIFSHAAADRERTPGERFDIDGDLDMQKGWPTSIKSTGNSTIGLSDARKFWESMDFAPYRILVGQYRQQGGNKVFHEIDEFIVRPDHRAALLGSATLAEITAIHDGITGFGRGEHVLARDWAQKQKQKIGPRLGAVALNPKIDGKAQRRLQCSVTITALESIAGVERFVDTFGVWGLPFSLKSGKRALAFGKDG